MTNKELENTMTTLAASLTEVAVTQAKLAVLVHEGLVETGTQIKALLLITQEHRRRLNEIQGTGEDF
jgi:hypothetical protein